MLRRASVVLVLLVPVAIWAANPAKPPQRYSNVVNSLVPQASGGFLFKLGFGSHNPNLGKGRVRLKIKDRSGALDDTDGTPCNGDEPLCLVPFVENGFVGYVVIRPEILGGIGFVDITDAAFGISPGSLLSFAQGACYPAGVVTPPALTTMATAPNDCMGLAYVSWPSPNLPPGYVFTIP